MSHHSGHRASRRTRSRSSGGHALAARALSCALIGAFIGAFIGVLAPSTTAQLRDDDGFVRADATRPIELPADHRSHPETRTEWWYLTGPLRADDGRLFGFQATWFRRGMTLAPAPGRSPMAVRDVMLFHGALSDPARGELVFEERASRAWGPWAGAADDRLEVHLLEHRFEAGAGPGDARLSFGAGDARVELALDLDACAPLLHGVEPGLSIKGPEPGQASWYYSLPRIPARGAITFADGERIAVTGTAWFDHEFGSSQLSDAQVGWDWFSVALDDGSDLMLYQMRLSDGSADATSSGTWRPAGGDATHLPVDAFTIEPLDRWTSPRTGTEYPSGWRLEVPSADLRLRVTPMLRDQELLTPGSTAVTYWEGLCRFEGSRAGRRVSGHGYVELVGYDRRFTERL